MWVDHVTSHVVKAGHTFVRYEDLIDKRDDVYNSALSLIQRKFNLKKKHKDWVRYEAVTSWVRPNAPPKPKAVDRKLVERLKQNIPIILMDKLGYGDCYSYGVDKYTTISKNTWMESVLILIRSSTSGIYQTWFMPRRIRS